VIKEFVRLLEAIHPDKSASRLQLDMARDAGLEGFKKLLREIERMQVRLARTKHRRNLLHSRLMGILNDLATGAVRLPRPVGLQDVVPEELEQTFRGFGDRDYPQLAQHLHKAIGQGDVLAYQRFLVEEALLNGSVILVEHLIRQSRQPKPAEKELEFLEDLRHHMVGVINHGLAKKTGYLVTPELGKHIDALIGRTLRFLVDLLTSDPPARLVIPTLGSDFDPESHEPTAGRPNTGSLQVRATLFPGLVVFEQTPRVVVKARVFTKRVNMGEPAKAS
jgi:hypothetical protein